MKLNTGCIYKIDYAGYRIDPSPLTLILYSGKKYTHGINITYLSKGLSNQLIEIIAKIATTQIKANDAYDLYHSHLKKKIPSVIRIAYRTYFTNKIKNPIFVSNGYFNTKDFLIKLKAGMSKTEYNKLKKDIRQSIKLAQDKKQLDRRIYKYNTLAKKNERLSLAEIDKRANDYMKKIKENLIPKKDNSVYTRYKKKR